MSLASCSRTITIRRFSRPAATHRPGRSCCLTFGRISNALIFRRLSHSDFFYFFYGTCVIRHGLIVLVTPGNRVFGPLEKRSTFLEFLLPALAKSRRLRSMDFKITAGGVSLCGKQMEKALCKVVLFRFACLLAGAFALHVLVRALCHKFIA